MVYKRKPDDIARVSAFVAAISPATERVNDFTARLGTLVSVSGKAELQIANVPTSAVQTIAYSQALATYCRGTCDVRPGEPNNGSSFPAEVSREFFRGAIAIGVARLSVEAIKWLRTSYVGQIAKSGLYAMGRAATFLWEFMSASEALAAVTETAGELIAAVAALAASIAL